MHFHRTAESMWRSAAAALHGVSLAAAAIAVVLAGCSKHPQNRYDRAMELAKTYSVGQVPVSLLDPLGPPISRGGYIFPDLAYNPTYLAKFKAAADQLGNQEYIQSDNRDTLLASVMISAQSTCEYEEEGHLRDASCHDRMLGFQVTPLRRLHTDLGDFIFASASKDNFHDPEMAINASQLVIVVDPTDGGLGLILEDRVATIGGRADLLAAVLTLASSIVRIESQIPGGAEVHAARLQYDLDAAKAHTLFKRQPGQTESGSEPTPTQQVSTEKSGASPPSLTKEEFQHLVVGKTMSEIRAALGRPSNTDEDADGVTWYYWSNDLKVDDPDAGITVNSSAITFDPVSKTAIGVHF